MKSLPQSSTGSVTGGIWFVFSDEGHTIRVWGSSLTGKERIYVGDQIVAEARNFKRHETIDFSIGDKKYAVTFNVISIMKGQLECILSRDGTPVDALLAKFVRTPFWKILLAMIAAGFAALAVLLTLFPHSPDWVWPLLLVLAALVAMSRLKGGAISIERIAV